MQWLNNTITYDRKTPIGGLYDDQSIFTHLHRLFDDFITVGTVNEPWITDFGLAGKSFTLKIDRSVMSKNWKMASSKQFADLIKGMGRRKFILWAPLDPPYRVNPLTYIMNSPTIAHAYEHKRYFRDEFSDLITMPEYVVLRLDELSGPMYSELRARFGGKFVIQDVESSGSKGTHIVSRRDSYDYAVKALKMTSYSGTVVVSEFVKGLPCSVQVCLTKYGIFTGGLQKQLINSKYLCNQTIASTTRWCGGELGGSFPEIVKHRVQEIATVVGSELASHGYRGIFGIDLLVTPENKVYAIEINARLTGYTHILSDMQLAKKKIPFSLLHILELGNYKYEVEDLDALANMTSLDEKFSYLLVMNQTDEPLKLAQEIKSGLYRVEGERIIYVRPSATVEDLKDEKSILIFCKYGKGVKINPGLRVLKVVKKGKSMASTGELDSKAQQLILNIKREFGLPLIGH